jgi:acyl-CoA synthetase (AMP-forming)/AMP-acid ligase II
MNLGNFLSALAARNPRKTAGVFENERISYEKLGHSSASLAGWLLQPDSPTRRPFRSLLAELTRTGEALVRGDCAG